METFPLPTSISVTSSEDGRKGTLTVEPLAPGYGTTIGNALRRVLLSALSGAAVTDVRIQGVDHEFSTIPNVKEDIVDIILNVKQLRFRAHTDTPIEVHLSVKGKKSVRGSDIEPNAEIEVVNPDAVIATLTSEDAELVMDLTVRRGRGYLPTEGREKENRAIGTLAIDALFSPIRNVGLTIEPVRVGQMTNYDRVVLTMETDGSVSPEDALKSSAKLLINHFQFIETLGAGNTTGEETPGNPLVYASSEEGKSA
jgi:DNA-directed RNA polymerase subunit alpha